jgi:putative transposase
VAVQKGYHCAYQIHYHLVFPVKYRKALLKGEVVKAIREVSQEIAERYEVEMERVGCDLNHIHVLCGAHPKYAPGQIVRLFKSITAREIFRRVPGLRQELWGGEFWSDGYYVATVGERGDWSVVEKYVRNQGHSPTAVQLRLL